MLRDRVGARLRVFAGGTILAPQPTGAGDDRAVYSRHLKGWIEIKSLWLDCPYFADVFEGREALECLQAPSIVVGIDEVVEVSFELPMVVILIA